MRKTILLILSFFAMGFAFAQSGFNFKGLVADNSGNPLANQVINVRITVFEGNTARWQEEHTGVNTDAYGIFSVNMGEGNKVGGTAATFDAVSWNNSNMNYRVEINSGSGYQILVDHEPFKFVPYAKRSVTAVKVTGIQDELSIGQDNAGRLLYVEGDPSNAELVNFYHTSMQSYDDVLQLTADTGAPDDAQFLEMRKGNSLVFDVDVNGDVHTIGNIEVDGEIHGDDSGDADMKAYIYGKIASDGTKVTNASSAGFTCSRTSTGHYEVHFTDNSISQDEYVVVAINHSSFDNIGVDYQDGYFKLFVTNTQSGNYTDRTVSFVVFKK